MKGSLKKFICGTVLSISAVLCSNYLAGPYVLPENIHNIYVELFEKRSAEPNLGEKLYTEINKLSKSDKIFAVFWICNEQAKSKIDVSLFADEICQNYDIFSFEFCKGICYHPSACDYCTFRPLSDKIVLKFSQKGNIDYSRTCKIIRPVLQSTLSNLKI